RYISWIQIKNDGAEYFYMKLELKVVAWPMRKRWFTRFLRKGILSSMTIRKGCLCITHGQMRFIVSPSTHNLVSLPLKPSHMYPLVSVETRMSKCHLFSKESSSSWIYEAL
ncbi:hypothetical protein HID58_017055, partial [Brassica napus]